MPAHPLARWCLRTCAVGTLLATEPAALLSTGGIAQSPVLVSVEFRATAAGVPVLDLRPGDVTLRIDGADADILALDLVRLDGARSPSPFATNAGSHRQRDLIFAIDEESIAPGGEAILRDALLEMLRQLTPRDRVGLISLHPSGPSVALSSSHAGVSAVLPRVRGRAIGPESATDLSCRTKRLLPAISSLIGGLDAGVTTTVLLFSAALAAPASVAVPARGAESACLLLSTDFDEFRAVTARSAAQLYAIHTADGTRRATDLISAAGLERLAGEARGRFLRLTGDSSSEMRSVALETSALYVASALAPAGARTRTVDIHVRRDAVVVRARPSIVMPAVEAKTVSPRDMMRSAAAHRDLPLRSAGFPARGTATQARVIVLFEPIDRAVPLAASMVGAFNSRGQLVAQWTSAPEDLANRPVAAALMLNPGTYRLRVAAVDARGRSGAVDDELQVELPAAGAISTSAVVLGTQALGGFSPRLQLTAPETTAVAYLEVYGVPTCAGVSGRLEVAGSEEGPAAITAAATAIPIDQSEGCILHGALDLASLPPGDYVLRVEVTSAGTAVARRLRMLRKAAR